MKAIKRKAESGWTWENFDNFRENDENRQMQMNSRKCLFQIYSVNYPELRDMEFLNEGDYKSIDNGTIIALRL